MDKLFRIVDKLCHNRSRRLLSVEDEELKKIFTIDQLQNLSSSAYERKVLRELSRYDSDKAYTAFIERKRFKRIIKLWYRIAVVILFSLISSWSLWYITNKSEIKRNDIVHLNTDKSKEVILTLSEGEKIPLKSDIVGYLQTLTNASLNSDSAILLYEKKVAQRVEYNEIHVPRGAEYSLILSDGTRIYLNSDSYLYYPVAFGSESREVKLLGEAYFEVAKDTCRPFTVRVGELAVKVLGTSFNIQAYANENTIETTLVQGMVAINCMSDTMLLNPGQQLCYLRNNQLMYKREVDTSLYVCWKDGKLKFERESLERIMATLERWYDVNIFFHHDELRTYLFSGDLKKYDSIDQHLKMLEETTHISFVVQGQNIFIGYK